MGIVAKQSIVNTLSTYIGFAFGALNTLFLFTYFISKESYGVVSYLLATSNLIWPLMAFGLQNTLIKFFSTYKNKEQQHTFFSWILLVPLGIFLITIAIYFLFYSQIVAYYTSTNPIIIPYVWVMLVLGVASAYFELFYAWAKVHLQTTKGTLLKQLFHRIAISILLLAVSFKLLSVEQFIYSLAIVFLVRTLLMKWIAFRIQKLIWQLTLLPNIKALILYSIFILIAATVSVFLLDLDKVMIESYLPVENVAIYSICAYMASVIEVPARALMQITNPLAAQLLVNKDINALKLLNQSSSINALVVACLVALLVVCNVQAIFQLVPNQYTLYIGIVVLISLVKIADSSLGITNAILFNSNAYQWVLIFGVIVLGLAYFLNSIFIPKYGIVGAAIATAVVYFLYNIIKLIFVYLKYEIQPFTKKTVHIIGITGVVGIIFYYLPLDTVLPIIHIIIKGLLISIIYIGIIYNLKISPEINSIIKKKWDKNKI